MHFVAKEAIEADLQTALRTATPLEAVHNTRRVFKEKMKLNDALPKVVVRADNFAVYIDDELVESDPVAELPMTQRYFLF